MAGVPWMENQGPLGPGGFDPTQTNPPQQKNQPNPYAPYTISDTYTGTYVGVPDNYYATVGYTPTFKAPGYGGTGYGGPGYGMGGGSLQGNDPVKRPPTDMYTVDYVQSFRGRVRDQQVYNMQVDLYNHGYLSKADWKNAGTFDRATELALGHAAGEANFQGQTLPEMFAEADSSKMALPSSKKKGPQGPVAHDYTSTSISLTGQAGAQQVLTQALTQQLGREPTDQEVTRFLHSLNAEERANPSVTHTHVSAGGDSSSTTQQSSVDAGAEAVVAAKSGPYKAERTQYQDSVYFDALASMMGGG